MLIRLFFIPFFFLVVSVFAVYANEFSYQGDKQSILDVDIPDEYYDGNHYTYFLKSGNPEVLNYQVIEEGLIIHPNLLPGNYILKIVKVTKDGEKTDVTYVGQVNDILINPFNTENFITSFK